MNTPPVPEWHSGAGSLRTLPGLLRDRGVRSCLLVTGGDSYVDSGAVELEGLLDGITHSRLDGVRPNPDSSELDSGVARLRAAGVDAVLGIGGGSVLDYAKAITALAAQDHPARECFTDPDWALANDREHLLVLVPTTAGTGSELTSIAVFTVDGRKRSLHHRSLLADLAVTDPELTRSMPPQVAASTGADALSQAVESYCSIRSTERSRGWALESITLSAANLAGSGAGDQRARAGMLRAAALSGLAIEQTQTIVPHALSYRLTTEFGVPHGHACGVFLGPVLAYNAGVGAADVADPRGAGFVRERVAELDGLLPGGVDPLLRAAGLELELSAFGVTPADVDGLVDAALASPRVAANPRHLPREALHELVTARL